MSVEDVVEHIWRYKRAQFIIPYVNPRKGKATLRASILHKTYFALKTVICMSDQ